MTLSYVHGYSARERARLSDQANALTDLPHADTVYPAGSHVLEAGRGIRDLHRTAEPDGTFRYTFFKAIGTR